MGLCGGVETWSEEGGYRSWKKLNFLDFFACFSLAVSAKRVWFPLKVMGGIKIVIDAATQL